MDEEHFLVFYRHTLYLGHSYSIGKSTNLRHDWYVWPLETLAKGVQTAAVRRTTEE